MGVGMEVSAPQFLQMPTNCRVTAALAGNASDRKGKK